MDEDRPRETQDTQESERSNDRKRGTGKPRKGSPTFTAEQRLLILDIWQRSELGAPAFGPLVGITDHTLYQWRRAFERHGPAGLEDRPRGRREGSRLPDRTQRAIRMLKRQHPDWGIDRIHDVLWRSEGYTASSGAIRRVLVEDGHTIEAVATRPHADPQPRSFERARPNQLWQTDLFTFTLKRENRRLYLVVYLDDHSRYVTGYGVSASSSGTLVREALEAAIVDYGPPEEVLTDNGTQYHTWRGRSAFRKLLDKRGIRHVVARPRHPQTLGKTERFWRTLWEECLETAVPRSVDDARERIGHFIGHYNFQRTHQGIGGLIPADRFFDAESEVRRMIEARIRANALDLARHGEPRKPFYLTGRVGSETIALHGEGGKVVLTREGGVREEVDLEATGRREGEGPEEGGAR